MTDLTLNMASDLLQAGSDRLSRVRIADPDPARATEAAPAHINAREAFRIPRIAVEAFCESTDIAAAIESVAADRLMSRTRVSVQMGGLAAAIAYYRQASTPNLVVVEGRFNGSAFLSELDQLADVCDAGTKVMVIGHANDITLYRELVRRGVSEYVLAPVNPVALIAAISSIYKDSSTSKLGQVIAFVGAKGGVGSSTVAHNVGWTIARQLSSDVVVADMDLPFGTAGLNYNIDTGTGVAEAIQDAGRLDEVLLDRLLTKCGDHLNLLSAPTALERPYDLHEGAIESLLEVAQSSVPFVILDMPHLWTAWAKNTLIAADEIVITAVPDLANLRNAKNLINVLKQARPNDAPPKLVLNQVGMPKRPEIKPGEFTKALQIEPIACVAFEPNLFGTAANKGQMISEISAKSAASKALGQMAQAITGRQQQKRGTNRFDFSSLFGKKKRSANGAGKRA